MSLTAEHAFSGKTFYNFDDNIDEARHRWFYFKEGFSHRLVAEAIARIGAAGDVLKLLDPFGGSGTTALTAALLGHDAVSLEVNPFCSFATRVKCSEGTWRAQNYRRAVQKVVDAVASSRAKSHLEGVSTFSERQGAEKWLFNKEVLRACAAAAASIDETAGAYAPPLRLAMVKAAMQSCNGKKDGKCVRYYSDWKKRAYSKDSFVDAFKTSAEHMLCDVLSYPISRERSVTAARGDARTLLAKIAPSSVDLVVTSPPYLNSLDYSDVYRPELFLGGFVTNNDQLRNIRLRTLRSHVQVKWSGPVAVDSELVTSVTEQVKSAGSLWNARLPEMIQAYFNDMARILKGVSRALKVGSEAWIVVSTSAYKSVQIPVDLILAELGTKAGMDLDGVYVLRNLRSSSQQWSRIGGRTPPLRESLIILKKTREFRSRKSKRYE